MTQAIDALDQPTHHSYRKDGISATDIISLGTASLRLDQPDPRRDCDEMKLNLVTPTGETPVSREGTTWTGPYSILNPDRYQALKDSSM